MFKYCALFLETTLIIVGTFIILAHGYSYTSAPGCPKERGTNVWLKDEEGNCHKLNSQGPCGENMLFFPHPNRGEKFLGFCDCFDARKETELEIQFLNDRKLSHCLEDPRSQIFVPERNRCYSTFDQGPCPNSKWLVLNATYYPVCVKNQCPSKEQNPNSLSPRFWFSHSAEDKCYETMTRGYCPKSYQLRYTPNDWLPKCRYQSSQEQKKNCPPKGAATEEVFRLRCKPGSRRDYLSKCSQSINPRR